MQIKSHKFFQLQTKITHDHQDQEKERKKQ